MRILLVSTLYDPEMSWYTGISEIKSLQAKTWLTPLNLATIAALTPDDVELDLWDEAVQGPIEESTDLKDYDLVGISFLSFRLSRAREIARFFHKLGTPVAAGGPGVSSAPEKCRDDFDIFFIGEAELTWPQFIADWKAGNYRKEYRQVSRPDFSISPIPQWDGIADHITDYYSGAVQTTRGCPFDCEFCDVIYLLGRRPRHKPIDQVLEEIRVIQKLGLNSIFFCDDNFIGNVRYAKDLLKEVIALNSIFPSPLSFQTQLSINVAKDDELLELLADANFAQFVIGIETPNIESLIETNKPQNYTIDLVEVAKKIMSYGVVIKAALVVGFDHDTTDIFDRQFEFLQETCIPVTSLHILEAPDGTRLWARLLAEGRLISDESRSHYHYGGRRYGTNIIPKRMTRVELLEGYADLLQRCSAWSDFAYRMKGMVSGVKRQPNVPNAVPDFTEEKLDQLLSILTMAKNSGMIDTLPLGRGGDSKGLNYLKEFFLLKDEEARNAIFDIIRHTLCHAPFMLDKVIRLILFNYSQRVHLPEHIEALRHQIDTEKSGEFTPKVAKGIIFIPESFKQPYKTLFPEIYERVYQGLQDKTRTEEALIEIFTDFIIRWRQSLEQFEEHHRLFLQEIADRTIAKENKVLEGKSVAFQQGEMPDVKKIGLADDILKYVQQELRGMRIDDFKGIAAK